MQTTERGEAWLSTVLEMLGFSSPIATKLEPVANSDAANGESNCWLIVDHSNFSQEQVETLIGKGGVNIDAIQYLANVSLNANLAEAEQLSYIIDINGYRHDRQQQLEQIAIAAADKVRSTSEPEQINDLSSAERKVVHTLLKDYPDLKTESRGREPHRHLIVSLQSASQEGDES
jgi:spoIIIJ-associated protein